MKRRGVSAIAVVLAVLALATSAAATRTVHIPSRVSIANHTGLRFVGRVTSPNHACEEQRRVVLLRVIENGPDQVMGRDTTRANGDWSVVASGFAGISLSHFYARVKRRGEGTAGTIYVCRADHSRTIELGA